MRILIFLAIFCVALPAWGELPQGLTRGGEGRVAAVIDGDTLRLEDHREIRLTGIQAPKLPLGRPGFEPWPLAEGAKTALMALVEGVKVKLYYGGARLDRHGRVLAQLEREDGLWIQQEMLRQGFARVYSFADNRIGIDELYESEDEARMERRGIWADDYYRPLRPGELEAEFAEYQGSFQIVIGRVRETGEARGRLYVNFGPRWKTDFTLEVAPSIRRRFRAAPQLDPANLDNRMIEVRGWIDSRNGPVIDITHPEQIRLLEEERP